MYIYVYIHTLCNVYKYSHSLYSMSTYTFTIHITLDRTNFACAQEYEK